MVRAEWPGELQFLFIEPSAEDVAEALDGWKWIGLDGLEPAVVSTFGDIFFRARDGSIHHLDMLDGQLGRVARNWAEFQAILQNETRRDELLLAGLVIAAQKNGLIPAAGQCYDFKKPPVLGGEMNVREMETTFFVVKVHIAGQIHRQVKDLPQGTKINKVTISDS
ncbi:T6SS immunity protein Tdi1 domain-containing protein [Mesorhizobium sp. 128a]